VSSTSESSGRAGPAATAGPDRVALTGFVALVLMGGINFPAVKATVEELAPFWSAGVRFAAAGLVLAAVVLIQRQPLPRGRALAGTLLFGALSFAAFYAFAYWGIERLPAGLASVVLASVPLVTFGAAVAHGLERFRWLTLAGGLLALAGIAVMLGGQGSGSLSVVGLVALLVAAVCAAEAGVVAKRFPPVSPLMMNAIGMTIGGVVLLGLSFGAGESHAAPTEAATWLGLVYLVVIGSIALFGTYLFVLRRWTASGTSYVFVLFPVVAVAFSGLFLGERITAGLVIGGVLVVAGVYVGALLHARPQHPEPPQRPAEPTSVVAAVEEETRPELAGVPADCFRCP
jgi:drug/metabolite transporter (DMT)-like permease